MAIFVLASKDESEMETPVLEAGEDGGAEAVLAFSTADKARNYAEHCGWSETFEPAELGPAGFLEWLLEADHQQIRFLAVDTDAAAQEAGAEQTVIEIAPHLEQLGLQLIRLVQEDF